MIHPKLLTCAVGFLALAASAPAGAAIVLTGQVAMIAAPDAVDSQTKPQNDGHAFLFAESTTALARDLKVDAHPTAANLGMTIDAKSDLNKGTIDAGTDVSSFLLYSNPKTGEQTYEGTVIFSGRILGVEVLSDNSDPGHKFGAGLDQTDFLGAPGTTYTPSTGPNPGDAARGLELTPDTFTFVTARELRFHFETSSSMDQIRIITAAAVPEPSGAILAASGIAGLGLGFGRRRRLARA